MHEKYKKFQCSRCDFGFWKIMGGRQLEPAEADTLLREREVGPLDGFRSRIGRPFSAKLKLNDANEVEFDFGPRADDDDGEAPDFTGADAARAVPEVRQPRVRDAQRVRLREGGRRRTAPAISARAAMILQRPIEREQMQKLLATGKTDLLQFVSARTRRPFSRVSRASRRTARSASSSRRRTRRARARGGARSAPLRVLGTHPRDEQPVELHAGRYGPYVKHGTTNATLPDRDKVDSLTLDEAVALVDEKAGRSPDALTRRTVGTRAPRKAPASPRNARRPRRRAGHEPPANGAGCGRARRSDKSTREGQVLQPSRGTVRKSAAKIASRSRRRASRRRRRPRRSAARPRPPEKPIAAGNRREDDEGAAARATRK